MLGQDPQHLRLGQRRVDRQGRFHEPAQLGGVTGGRLLGLAALAPQQDPLDRDGTRSASPPAVSRSERRYPRRPTPVTKLRAPNDRPRRCTGTTNIDSIPESDSVSL